MQALGETTGKKDSKGLSRIPRENYSNAPGNENYDYTAIDETIHNRDAVLDEAVDSEPSYKKMASMRTRLRKSITQEFCMEFSKVQSWSALEKWGKSP